MHLAVLPWHYIWSHLAFGTDSTRTKQKHRNVTVITVNKRLILPFYIRSRFGINSVRWPVSRVLSFVAEGMTIPLGRPLRNASRDLPGRRRGNAPIAIPIWSCSRWGLPCRLRCRSRGALLPHLFTLTWTVKAHRRFVLCGAIPGVAPAGRYPAPCFRGARTFLQPHHR